MKKQIALGLSAVLLLTALVGCDGGEKTSNDYLLDIQYSDYVKLCDYDGIEATKVVYEVTDEEVEEEIEMELYDFVTYDPITDRAIQDGDYVNINYTATLDGEDAADYSGEEEDVMVGEGYMYPEVEEALIGMETGEEKEVSVELTEEFAEEEEDLGKTLSVKVKVNDISVENIPECTDEFVKENFDCDSVKEYKASVKEMIESSKEEEYSYVAKEEIMQYILDNSEFDGYPQELYDQCEEDYNAANEYYASMYGMELEDYLETFGIDEETKKQEIEDSIHYELVIGAIAQKEQIGCSEKDIEKFVEDNYEDYGYETPEEFSDDYTDDDFGGQIIYESVLDVLYEKASFVEISEEEYIEQQNADLFQVDDSEAEGVDASEEEIGDEESEQTSEEQDSEEESVAEEEDKDSEADSADTETEEEK